MKDAINSVVGALKYISQLADGEKINLANLRVDIPDAILKNEIFVEHYAQMVLEIAPSYVEIFLESIGASNLTPKAALLLYKLKNTSNKREMLDEVFENRSRKNYSLIIKSLFLDRYGREGVKSNLGPFESLGESDFFKNLNSHIFNDYLKYYNYFIESNKGNKSLFTDLNPCELQYVVDRVKRALRSNAPFSLIRLGDGEGSFLPGENRMAFDDQNKILEIWFGDSSLSVLDRKVFTESLCCAIEMSDFIGVPSLKRVIEDFRPSNDNRNYRSLSAIYRYCVDKEDKEFVSSFVHADLHFSGKLREIAQVAEAVCVISGHDERALTSSLKNSLSCNVSSYMKVPSEKKFSRLFGYDLIERHYPDVYNNILNEIASKNRKGHLFLVGAGFLGKRYCAAVKQAGGVAIDVGSVFDYVIGFKTRRF